MNVYLGIILSKQLFLIQILEVLSSRCLMLGMADTMRVSSVISPASLRGTLKSTRISTGFDGFTWQLGQESHQTNVANEARSA